ncbi:hypothetical protein V8G54_020715 [Vigna mungo]|uniref:Uncharacterized protein n=1 Tax=Vigna mungo TaxID=3915 RepID=A0AAQ3RWP6_VIGMU
MHVQPALITSPYRNTPFYYGGFAIPSPSYRMPGQFGSFIPHLGMEYDYGLYARPGAPYGPLAMFPPGSFGGIDGYGYGFQSPQWAECLVADHFASRKRRGAEAIRGCFILHLYEGQMVYLKGTGFVQNVRMLTLPLEPLATSNTVELPDQAQTNQVQQLFLKVVGLVKSAVTLTIPFEMYATAKTVELIKMFLFSVIM